MAQTSGFIGGKEVKTEDRSIPENLTDVYISVFFDGTANNIYEQVYKKERRDERNKKIDKFAAQMAVAPAYAISSILFNSSKNMANTYSQNKSDKQQYGMEHFSEQKEKAENDLNISEHDPNVKKDAKNLDDNGGWKYSNVAILRSLVKNKEAKETKSPENGEKVIGIDYNIYVEGSGKKWDGGSDAIGLGMGTGRTGVVGLVSKAMVLVDNFLKSCIPLSHRPKVKLHFAVFGFSRGATCGRLFSFLITDDQNSLPKKEEFKQYLPQSLYSGGNLRFLEDFKEDNKTVDFLGIYDTVSSIGFLKKNDNSTDYSINQFKETEKGSGQYINKLTGLFGAKNKIKKSDAYGTYHCDNAREYGLYSPQNNRVKHAIHICAIDEFRENFALVDLGAEIKSHCTEIFMPGCHSDIGGGYINEDTDKRVTLRRHINPLINSMFNYHLTPTRLNRSIDPRSVEIEEFYKKPPKSLKQMDILSPQELIDLGWMDADKEIKSPQFTPTEKIIFNQNSMEGYSNIPLKMMKERAMGALGLLKIWPKEFLPFTGQLPTRFAVPGDAILNEIKTQCQSVFAEGQRHWVLPSSLKNYVAIRRKYLHLTCTDVLRDNGLKATGGNMGNPPNWQKRKSPNGNDYYLLCRLIYHGDNNDSKLHDMTEYN